MEYRVRVGAQDKKQIEKKKELRKRGDVTDRVVMKE